MTDMLRDIRGGWNDSAPSPIPVAALFLHGYGSNEYDLGGLASALDLGMPWASLRAPAEQVGGGAAWFRIVTPGNPEREPVVQATEAIWAWVDKHLDPDAHIVPIGFSQGGLMASQLLRTRPARVAATVILGGFVLGAEQPADATLARTLPPVFWGRGADDRVITAEAVARTERFLPAHATLTRCIYPGLAHGINRTETVDVREFVHSVVQMPFRSSPDV